MGYLGKALKRVQVIPLEHPIPATKEPAQRQPRAIPAPEVAEPTAGASEPAPAGQHTPSPTFP